MAINRKHYFLPVIIGVWIFANYYVSSSSRSRASSPHAKAEFGSGKMFDKFADYYDTGNWFMSLGQDQKWRDAMLFEADVGIGDTLLDLATGSADVAIAAKSKFNATSVVGLDPSVEMLRVGRAKIGDMGLKNIELVVGDAQAMPEFSPGQFSKITMSFGIRNVPDRLKALKEMRRVISEKSNSRLAIMEFSAPSPDTVWGYTAKLFVRYVVPVIGGIISSATDEYQYLEESIFKFPEPEAFEAIIESAGFRMVKRTSFVAGVVNIYIAEPKI